MSIKDIVTSKTGYERRIALLKAWFGWDDEMIKFVKKEKGLALAYKIMTRESEGVKDKG